MVGSNFTYWPTVLSPLDAVRSRIGDTDTTDQLLTDEEIAYYLMAEGGGESTTTADTVTILRASIVCCKAIAAKFARKATTQVKGELTKAFSDMHKHYLTIARELRRELNRGGIAPTAGGLSISGRQAVDADTDRVPPIFERDQFSESGTSMPTGAPSPLSGDSVSA